MNTNEVVRENLMADDDGAILDLLDAHDHLGAEVVSLRAQLEEREAARKGQVAALYSELAAANAAFATAEAERDRAHEVLRAVDAHYSASLDYKPPYVAMARAALPSTPDETEMT